jgi:hypothetical protein
MHKQVQRKEHKKEKHCSRSSGCDRPFHKTVPVPGAHFSLSDCHTSKSVCCDIDQKDARLCGKDKCFKPQNGVIKIVPEPLCVKAPHFDCNVKVNAKCIKPGTAHVQAGDVHIGKQKIRIEVLEPEQKCGKPTYKVRCCAPKQEIAPPKIDFTPGRVHFDCEPEIHVVYVKRKDCDRKKSCDDRKKQHHKRRH